MPPPKTSKRSRRRRNMKSRKTQVEPMVADQQKSKKQHDAPMTKSDLYFALDCEMVGTGPEGFDSAVARVTVVNWENKIVLDTFVKVPVPVTDYRSHISGIQPSDIESDQAMTFDEVRAAVENILRGKILIGHGLENDLCSLSLTHPYCDVRDTARYVPYMREMMDYESGKVLLQARKLRDLAWEKLGRQIQLDGEAHSPVEDSIAALDLYKLARTEWEEQLRVQQMERIHEAENQPRRSFFPNPISMTSTPPPPPSNVGMYDPAVAVGYSYGGPFGPAVPGFTPAPPRANLEESPQLPSQQEEASPAPSSTTTSTSWRWYPSLRRPKSPPVEESIPEEGTSALFTEIEAPQEPKEVSQEAPASPKSNGFFFLRRSRSPSQQRPRVEHAVSSETDNTTVCTETESNLDFASEAEHTRDWAPDYTYLQETGWSQSFQVVDGGDAARDQTTNSERVSVRLLEEPSEPDDYYLGEEFRAYQDWYQRREHEANGVRYMSI